MCVTPFQQLSDNYLVIQYQREKEAAAFEALYRRYAKRVFHYCNKIIGNREDAQDTAMEVFEKTFENIDRLKSAGNFQSWLFRIARNRSINTCLRKQHKYYIPIDDAYDLTDEVADLEDYEQRDAKVVKMEAAIQALPEATKDLLIAKYYEKESIQSLMQRYHLSESAVKMRLARARQKANELYLSA